MKKPGWLKYDAGAGSISVTDWEGKTCCYIRGLHLQAVGGSDVEVAFAGGVVLFNETALRVLPDKIVVKRLAETNPLFGTPLRGASDARFEYVRRERS